MILILIVIVAFYFIKNNQGKESKTIINESQSNDNSMRILNERLAKGEMTTEEYEKTKETLMK